MTYDSQRASYEREHIYIVEIEQDYCPLESGVGLCTATETGDDKCYQTFNTCNDLANYRDSVTSKGLPVSFDENTPFDAFKIPLAEFVDWEDLGFTTGALSGQAVSASGFSQAALNQSDIGVVSVGGATLSIVDLASGLIDEAASTDHVVYENKGKTYRFCEARSPHPVGIDAIPSLQSVSLTPAKIDYRGGLGERSSVSLTFNDHPFNDLDVDKYVDERSYIASDRGLFWTKFRARNPNYQFRSLRVLTGYLENGEFKVENFKTRHYVIDKLDASNGKCTITAKDPLKKASAKKAQVPAVSNGFTSAALTDTDTSVTLTPAGIGDDEYPTSGWVTLSGSEVVSFTRSDDALTIVRAQYNTEAQAHDSGVVVQLCYQKTDTLDEILYDIIVNYAGIESGFINKAAWATEVSESNGIKGNLSGLIAKPTDVDKVLKELSEAKPYSMYWDELNQIIKLDVLKPPPDAANVINMDDNLISGSVRVVDKPGLRASTVFFTFGQIDPTKSLTEPSNYTQTIVRTDSDSIVEYGSNQIKTIVSRWIPSTDKTTAENAAQLYGRRFSKIPREISFSVDAKDNSLGLGENRSVNHSDVLDASGLPLDTIYQIISKQEADYFKYKGLEYTFGDTIDSDNNLDDDTIKISVDENNIDLYDKYFAKFGAPTASTEAVFKVETNVIVGSSVSTSPALDTGTGWPVGATIEVINNGFIVGKGGDGGSRSGLGTANGTDGGDAINLQFDLTLTNYGIVGGGGGGGGSVLLINNWAMGGGGAGAVAGDGFSLADSGALEIGGAANLKGSGSGGDGGDLGSDGDAASAVSSNATGGAAGKAADLNGNTLTYDALSDIRGDVS